MILLYLLSDRYKRMWILKLRTNEKMDGKCGLINTMKMVTEGFVQ